MALYRSHGLTLRVNSLDENIALSIDHLLQDLSWVRNDTFDAEPSLCLNVGLEDQRVQAPATARELFRADGYVGLEVGEDFYFTDGSSIFRHQAATAEGDISLSVSFLGKPILHQRIFWGFAILKLLRGLGIFGLHAAGVTRNGRGVLILGSSGSGKSTLTIGLIRLGWSYLSDDTLLLRDNPNSVEALAFRKHFFINADAAGSYTDFTLGDELPDSYGGRKRKVQIEQLYPAQYKPSCDPKVLLFSQIVPAAASEARPMDRITAFENLLTQSGPRLFDQKTMGRQLEVLKRLLQQTTCYELRAGLDLYRDPAILMQLLNDTVGGERWLD